MSERVRSCNSIFSSKATGGNINNGNGDVYNGNGVAICNPTLISSTLSNHHNLTSTGDLISARDINASPHTANEMTSTTDITATGIAALSTSYAKNIVCGTNVAAQLNSQILASDNINTTTNINTNISSNNNSSSSYNTHNSNNSNNKRAIMAESSVVINSSCIEHNSIMNNSQMSDTANDSMLPVNNHTQLSTIVAATAIATTTTTTTATTTATTTNISSGNSMSLVKAGAGKPPIIAQSVAGKSCRFPKLEECAHFHYERVQLGPLRVRLIDDKADFTNSSIASQSIGGDTGSICTNNGGAGHSSLRSFSPSSCWFIIKVFPHNSDAFLVKRSFDNVQMLDEMLHRCVYDRKISGLKNLKEVDYKTEEDVEYAVSKYFERFSKIASDSLTCGTILTWFQLDNKGRRLPLADGDTMRSINTPAVGAAYGVRRYQAQASDEISIEVGDMISVIDMPSPAESIWWRGKKSHLQKSHYEVGFFPQSCVATIGDKIPRHFPMPAPLVGQLDVSPTKPVLRKHGKLIAFFRSFILSRPSRRRLKQSGIYRERVFSCDLSEHLLNSGQEIPMVLKCCAEFIEQYGIVDGIYRLSGITSNIQRLRRAFDEERVPDLGNPEMKQDIHAVSSLLKMYFRELPNPLCTYQLYDNFVEAIQAKAESNERLRLMKETVLKLPPPHYRTLKYLAEHLSKISQHSDRTGMTDKNLAIVWAPNLLRSPALESGGVAALRGVGVQAVVTEYLIKNCQCIFDILEDTSIRLNYIATQSVQAAQTTPSGADGHLDSLTDCESLLVEQREHDQSLTWIERPKSLNTGGPKLISLEEAQERHSKLESFDMKQSMPINMSSSVNAGANIGSYIEVGGGPSSLPDKYHTVLSVPRSWQKRKTHSWKSLFSRNPQRSISNGTANDLKSSIVEQTRSFDKSMATPMPRHKESAQVTFADTDSIISLNGKSTTKGFLSKRDDKHKSTELFETSRSYCNEPSKPVEVCVRSNSIDSLRTTGHSRSVSHDSYFDLLQSPQRSNVTTCPSRELSELGLNFDREEPEMHIFSETESLVSSPRVGKENIPPLSGTATRRIMRARPEDFSSQTNSVNPSPKKQPRLNILLSPSSATTTISTSTNWSQSKPLCESECSTDNCYEHHVDESCCKRYKLEDQLSDIQFIDCGTPEHTISNPQMLYTSVQVHGPPQSNGTSKSAPYSATEVKLQKAKEPSKITTNRTNPVKINGAQNTRYSYPTIQLGSKRKDQDMGSIINNVKERFSYPNTNLNSDNHYAAKDAISKILLEDIVYNVHSGGNKNDTGDHPSHNYNNVNLRNNQFSGSKTATNSTNATPKMSAQKHMVPKPSSFDVMKLKNRNSYCGGTDHLQQQLLRSCSAEITKNAINVENAANQSRPPKDMEISKISVTPSSPIQSPRYSLLMGGDTSSENSSAVNTPQHDLNPLTIGSIMSGISATSSNQMHQMLLGLDAMNYLSTSQESLGSHMTDKRDMQELKRELSLDLNPLNSKLSLEMAHLIQRNLPNLISPNNSNFTDNTSQSVTPSEFGYQNLQRQLSVHSLIETEDNSPVYEEYENTPSNLNSPMKLNNTPLKSTISITYNLKSPTKEDNCISIFEKPKDKSALRPLLETSFDENTVYEQVKFFRNSVTEVNQLLNEERKYHNTELENLAEVEELSDSENEIDKYLTHNSIEENVNNRGKEERIRLLLNPDIQENLDDILMVDNGLERDKLLLYENVEIRKPTTVYQNLLGEEMKGTNGGDGDGDGDGDDGDDDDGGGDDGDGDDGEDASVGAGAGNTINVVDDSETAHLLLQEEDDGEEDEEVELDSLDSIKEEQTDTTDILAASAARRSPSNFSVKELANKFESSPVEQMPPFDFLNHPLRTSQKRSQTIRENKPPRNLSIPSDSLKPKLNKKQQQQQTITRSLDENAFVREFGTKTLQDISVRYSEQLTDTTEIIYRRKSVDFTKPKTLNPPKRLPGMPITEEVYVKTINKPQHMIQLVKEKNINSIQCIGERVCTAEQDYTPDELKITPITENRISLIQNNITMNILDSNAANNSRKSIISADINNSNLSVDGTNINLTTNMTNTTNATHTTNTNNTTNIGNTMTNSLKVLSGVKLDRERIDRIKEERRQQLTQKYYNDFKSKSKTDLHSYKNDEEKFANNTSLRVKSKSRADIRNLQKDIDNLQEFGGPNPPSTAISELTLNTNQHRIRSLSDEQNQNIYDNSNVNANTVINQPNIKCNSNSSNVPDLNRKSMIKISKLSAQGGRRSEEFSARANVQKFERKSMDFAHGINVNTITGNRERQQRSSLEIASNILTSSVGRNSLLTNREKISPQFSIRDVTAMFESRSQSQHQ